MTSYYPYPASVSSSQLKVLNQVWEAVQRPGSAVTMERDVVSVCATTVAAK